MSTKKKDLKYYLPVAGILRNIPQILSRGKRGLFNIITCFFALSCADELPNYPVPLDTPPSDLIKIDASNKSKLIFSWPEVENSNGFEFSLYEVNDKGSTILGIVGKEKEVVMGTSVEREQKELTYYKIVLKALGDKKNRSNAQLETEKFWNNIPSVLITPLPNQWTISSESNDTKLVVSWPEVANASGYEFSLYKVDENGENPEPVGTEKEVVNGTSVERPQEARTYYKIVLKVLGDENTYVDGKLYVNGNPEERLWDNVPVELIPTGTNLTEFFKNNPITGEAEKLFVLASYGNYTMNGNIELGTTPVVIRSQSKAGIATIAVTDGSFVNSGAAFKLDNIVLDYSGFITSKDAPNDNLTKNAVLLMSPKYPDGAIFGVVGGSNPVLVVPVTSPIVLKSCIIKGLKGYLFYDYGSAFPSTPGYAIGTLTIDDCIIGMNTNTFNQATIRGERSLIKDLTITNTTFYNEATPPANSSNRFIQFNSNFRIPEVVPPAGMGPAWTGGNLIINSCTFWQVGKGAQVFNSNGPMNRPEDLKVVTKTLFVDCFETGRILNRLGANVEQSKGSNSQWYDGAAPTGTQDNSFECINTNPGLNYTGNGQFTMSGADQIAAGIGDPRWSK